MSSYLWPNSTNSEKIGDVNEAENTADSNEVSSDISVVAPERDTSEENPSEENTQSTQTDESCEADNTETCCGESCEADNTETCCGESCDEDDDDEDDENNPSYGSFKIETEKVNYVISINGRPFYYNTDLSNAYKIMWRLTRSITRNLSDESHIRIEPIGDNKLQIYSTYKFFIISYESLLHTISCHRAKLAVPTSV